MTEESSEESSFSLWGWEDLFLEIERLLEESNARYRTSSPEFAEYVVERMQIVIRALAAISHSLESDDDDLRKLQSSIDVARNSCQALQSLWQVEIDAVEDNLGAAPSEAGYSVPRVVDGRGRPRAVVSQEQLLYLRSLNFSWTQIAQLLGVSRVTLFRRRRELGIDDSDILRSMDDNELRSFISQVKEEFPTIGESLVIARIHSAGYHVSRARIRSAVRITDPINTALRWRGITTSRRPYSVAGPNSLWHIDGHHKLVRWGLVSHGGIDGYSRLVVYLQCSGNNRSSTVYDLFLSAVRRYSLPSRVRSDHGRENYLVAVHMLEHRGTQRNSMITGSSIHNQRIEPFWRDMHRCVTVLYYRLFYYLEHQNHLDPDNDIHRYALHYVFLPCINHSLQIFMDCWNHHSVRTENNMSPHQMFTAGALHLQRTGLHALDFFDTVDDMYGAYEDSVEQDEHTVYVPSNRFQLSDEAFSQLHRTVDPQAPSSNFGIELYLQTLSFIYIPNFELFLKCGIIPFGFGIYFFIIIIITLISIMSAHMHAELLMSQTWLYK